MKKINIVANYSSLYGGNFIPSLYELAKELAKENDVFFSFPERAKDRNWCKYITENGFKVCFFGNKIIKDVKRINSENKINVVYTHFISTPIAKLFSPLSKKIKLVIHIHSDFRGGNEKIALSSKIKKAVFEKMLRKDSKYIYVSETLKNEDNLKNSFYVRNGLCVNRIPSNGESVSSFPKSNKTTFLMYGWSPYVKGVDIVVKAFNALPDEPKRKNRLVIVHDLNKKDSCINYLSEKLNINVEKCENIILVEPSENVFDFYKQADVFVSASRSEGFSYSILEALYFGLPVIMSNIPGTNWATKYGAIPFEINDTNDLINKIEHMPIKKSKCVNSKIESDFDIKKWVESISSILLR